MLVIITSPAAIINSLAKPDPAVVKALVDAQANGNPVGVVSNHPKPAWFDAAFAGTNVTYVHHEGRQNGEVIKQISAGLGKPTHDILVLAAKAEDIQMAKNGGAVLIAAGWSGDRQVKALGIKINDPSEIQEVIALTDGWQGHWWYEANAAAYSARALMDLSGYGKDDAQVIFAAKLTNTVKKGGNHLTALLIVTARSLLIEKVADKENLFWGVYPSSKSANNDSEVLSDFTHRLRTTVSRVHFARANKPLLIRHAPSNKRSANKGGDRTDPTDQITTLHLNPAYKKNIRGRNVVLIDDCTTYGLSFGVAAALLRKAGANSVLCVALGKFGNTINYFEIEILTDPFSPIPANGFKVKKLQPMTGKSDNTAQAILKKLIH
ncbi:phosphoribosyltransferase [Pseudomonas aeruginosa]|uniref:phosphoribosyltransferase n=1 Tax=Pseudomonas aeruginosa TaxID=287 RepID=UPI000BB95E82|nr:hypothetical protein [Pseudomonas aeruginosa]MBA5359999.1 hypothetical protein [Pseudomonas aeruginosa]MBH4516412.1 hypothetical protein [Pseudomonas aeruginosa]MBX6663426.1 hypothetical protein [Pseudomonas aeruginosa]MCB5969369.1 hypothetical protein [Pseudomonas aeruginosa]MCC0561605.1 hypothetical protein [Pseudomonas aeruginosa]